MGILQSLRKAIWDTTTSIVADTIALWSPNAAAAYRRGRAVYWSRAYAAANLKGPYQLNRPTNRTGDVEVYGASNTVRAKVRDLTRNNPLVAGLKLKNATMVVGDEVGVKVQARGRDGKALVEVNAEIERQFYRWAEAACVTGDSLTEACYLVENHLLEDGEIIAKDVILQGQRKANPYRIQLLEADHFDTQQGKYGITYDANGAPKTYHLYRDHPGGDTPNSTVDDIPADMIVHLAVRDRASQRRGISPLAPAVFKLYGADDLEDAELVASRAAAAYGVIIKSPMVDTLPAGGYVGEDGTSTDSPTDGNGKTLEYLEAGGILRLDAGEDAIPFKNERPNSNFDSFIRGRQRGAVGAVGISYESGTGDYSQVNYSSARMGRTVEWANTRRRQKQLIKLLNHIYRKWLRIAVAMGQIRGLTPALFNADPANFEAVSWQLAGNDGIDPVKEVEAFERELALGVNSRTRFAAERGRDFSEIVREVSEENEILEAAGLPVSADSPPAPPIPADEPDGDDSPDDQPMIEEGSTNAA